MDELTAEQREIIRKRQRLEYYTLFKSPEEVAEIYKEVGQVDMSAHALCYACRFRGVEWVKVLVENSATFDYNREEVKFPNRPYIWYKIDFSLGMLRFSKTIKRSFYAQGNLHDWCFPDPYKLEKANKIIEVLPLEERLKCFDYLVTVADKVSFDPQMFLYNAVLSNNMDMVKALRERGIDLPEQKKTMVTKPDKETANDWYEFTWHLNLMSDDEFYSVGNCLLELTGAPVLKYTNGVFYDIMRHRFGNPEFFKYIVTHFDQKKMNKTEIMREIIDRDAIPCLPICEEIGWLSMNRRRDELIKHATEKKKTEAIAWLMDFKNRTADFAAEREKAEKKMMRELNADPNSIGEMKKIWTYKKQEDGTLVITSYKGSATVVTIPEKIGKDTVTAIGEYALAGGSPKAAEQHREVRRKITKIIIPDTIKRIDEYAFLKCFSLTEINIPDGITEISDCMFMYCEKLKSIKLPESVTKIGAGAFSHCENLKSAELSESVTIIGDNAFGHCERLEKLNIPDNVTEIGRFAFFACARVKSFDIPSAVKSIGEGAFSHCESITELKLPRGITEIGDNMLAYCFNLKSVEIPDTVETIGEYAFLCCEEIKRIELPDSVTNIMVYAFRNCLKLETVTLPSSVKQIKNWTHSGQKPDTVFDESPNVTAIVEPKSYAERYCKRNEIKYKYSEVK
ncbi:MAG: leucine-rich repeat domain-containing protein [Ruminococcaceae bacterium]|nr:leucine-rich repeat domain-containing protein [Oscillospiraceae bacterium]